ncbi:endoplasmic reticulum resident protein 44-like, partial [Plakobranchus ocellatus]
MDVYIFLQELTEEGLPFVILFHHPDDSATPDLFRHRVQIEVAHEKASVNFLVADGLKFAHPLHHLGKSPKDLPILAIDSFRHMYIFPHSVNDGLNTDGLLRKFIEDLHSGKLHREFHHGPDPTPPAIEVVKKDEAPTPDSNK